MRNEDSDYELLEREELGLLVELRQKMESRAAHLAEHPVRGPEGRGELSKIALILDMARAVLGPSAAPIPA